MNPTALAPRPNPSPASAHRRRAPAIAAAISTTALALLGAIAGSALAAPDASRIATAEAVVDSLSHGDFAGVAARFDETMQRALPAAKLAQTWGTLTAQVGRYERRMRSRAERLAGFDVVFVTTLFANATLDVKIAFAADGRIAGLYFVPTEVSDFPSASSHGQTPDGGDTAADGHGQAPTAAPEPPPYAHRDAFDEREVTVGVAPWALPGTLSIPHGAGPFPAVVLVHGSGPEDRDETIGPNTPFRDLAWGLASRGVAVLRYDKRTKVHGAAMADLPSITVREEAVDDAVAAAELLRRTPGIDPRRVFVLGHSLGGMLAPRIAKADGHLAGLIVLAGTARPLEDVIVDQLTYLTSLKGPSPSRADSLAKAAAQAKAIKALDPKHPDTDAPLMGIPASYWLDLRGYRPAETARALALPMFIAQGGRDYQATSADFELWKAALGRRTDVVLRLYPALNHLFMSGVGTATPAEYERAGHVDAALIEDVAAFVTARR